ncbi:MAG: tetratricopeptide repeat protein [Candidatus Poribacteria bacterium]|nr:tetratricopeptide repeat protein [Candidatus Poribacteria bacterium]
MKNRYMIFCLLMFVLNHQIAHAQQNIAQQAFTIFEQHCLDCHGEFGSYADILTIKHSNLIEDKSVLPRQPDASEFYLRLLGDTDNGSQMPLGQDPLDTEAIATIRRWIEAGAPDWEAIPKPKRDFITTEAMLKSIHTHVTSLSDFDRSFARYFTLTHLYNAGATDANLRAYRIALSKLINSLSWGAEVIKPKPIDQEETIFYIDLRNYEWDIKTDKWYKIEQAYPYGVQLKSATYTTLCEETDCELPFIRADWFIATASLPPLYHDILDLPKTDRELETQLEVNIAENLKNAPGVRVWRAGFSESGVSVNNRIVERHKSRYGAYWKSYDFAGNVGKQNIFTHPLDFTHDGGEIIFNLPNGLQAYYLSTATGERLDEAPINIVSDAGSRDPVVRNGLSCMGCHTEGMKTFADGIRTVIEQNLNPSYDKAQALRLYTEKSTMDRLVSADIARYRQAIAAAGGVFGGSEPIQQLVKQFEGPLDAAHAAAEVGLETDYFLKKIRENSILQNVGLLVLGVEKGSVKRDAWDSQFDMVISALNLGRSPSFVEQLFQAAEELSGQADYEGAIIKYTKALEESRKHGVKTEVIDKDFTTLANFKIAVSYYRLAEQTDEVNHYETAIQFIENSAPNATIPKHQEGLTYLWGHVLYQTEQFTLAETKFKQLIENFPNSPQVENAWYAIGQLNYKLGNYQDSRTAFNNILVNFPNSEFKDDAQLLIAQSFLDENNYDQAYPEFDKFATEEFKNYPDLHAESMYKAAYCLHQLNKNDEALGRYTKFIAQFPEHELITAAYFDQGAIYTQRKDYDKARANYKLALQSTSDWGLQAEVQSAIGRIYFDQGKYKNAIVSYTNLLERYPDSHFIAEAKLGIADSHFHMESWSEAVTAYKRILNDHKEVSDYIPYCTYQIGEAYYKLGTKQNNAGQKQQAIETLKHALSWYQKAIKEHPKDDIVPHARYGVDLTLKALGRKK